MIGWLGDEMWRDNQKRLSCAQPHSTDHLGGLISWKTPACTPWVGHSFAITEMPFEISVATAWVKAMS